MKDYLTRLASDLNRFPSAKSKTPAPPLSMCVSLLLDALELGLLLPPIVEKTEEEAPEETDSQSLTDSDLSPSRPDSRIVESTEKALEEGEEEKECDGAGEGPVEEACEAVEEGLDEGNIQGGDSQVTTSVASPPPSPATVQNQNTSTVSLEGELSNALSVTKDVTKDALSASLDLTKGALSITKDAFSILSRGSAMSKIFSTQSK